VNTTAAYNRSTLERLVRSNLGTDLGELDITPIRTGKHNQSYRILTRLGSYVLRIAPPDTTGLLFYERRMMRQEPFLHRILRQHTQLPVARIISHDFGRAVIDRDYVLMEMLPGTPLSEAHWLGSAQRARALEQVGGYLRQLHALTATEILGVAAYGYLGEHHPIPAQPSWQSAFSTMWNRLLDDVVTSGVYRHGEAQVMRDLLETHLPSFAHTVAPCLLHMDIWDQNILVDDEGNVTGLVDFDRALWGDPEIEYAVLDYCAISEPAFWSGYGAARDTSPAAEIRRLFYLLYEVQKYMPIAIWRQDDPAGALRYKEHSFGLAAALLRSS